MTGWRETLQALDTKLATTSASKEELERWNLLSQSQWQLHLEVYIKKAHPSLSSSFYLSALLCSCASLNVKMRHSTVVREKRRKEKL
jgi:hypothetical protein